MGSDAMGLQVVPTSADQAHSYLTSPNRLRPDGFYLVLTINPLVISKFIVGSPRPLI